MTVIAPVVSSRAASTPLASRPFSGPRGHLRPLDGIRGLAILMVMGCHLFESNTEGSGALIRFAGTVLGYGIFGVDLFFLLSGFLITGILFDSLHDAGFFRKFYARRVLRIFPLYYGVLGVLFVLTPALHLQWNGMVWPLLLYLQNLWASRIDGLHLSPNIALYHFWSLAVEEQFYLVWPALVFLVRGKRRLFLLAVAGSVGALLLRIGLIAHGVPHIVIHVGTVTRADSLLLGGALSLLYRSRYWPAVLKAAPVGFFVAAATIVASIYLLGSDVSAHAPFSQAVRYWLDGGRYTVLALGSAGLVSWSLRPGSACGWIFERRWLGFFGKYSYGIYVLHVIALPFLIRTQRAAIFQATHSKLLAVVGAGFSSLAIAVIAAYLSFHLFERPFLRLKHYFDYSQRSLNEASFPVAE